MQSIAAQMLSIPSMMTSRVSSGGSEILRTTTLPTGDVIDIECESYPLPPDAPLVATPVSWVQLPPGTRRSQE